MSMRKISVDGEEWRYLVGDQFVKIRGPNDESRSVEIVKLLGLKSESELDYARGFDFVVEEDGGEVLAKVEKGDIKRGAVTPKHIRALILDIKAGRK